MRYRWEKYYTTDGFIHWKNFIFFEFHGCQRWRASQLISALYMGDEGPRHIAISTIQTKYLSSCISSYRKIVHTVLYDRKKRKVDSQPTARDTVQMLKMAEYTRVVYDRHVNKLLSVNTTLDKYIRLPFIYILYVYTQCVKSAKSTVNILWSMNATDSSTKHRDKLYDDSCHSSSHCYPTFFLWL